MNPDPNQDPNNQSFNADKKEDNKEGTSNNEKDAKNNGGISPFFPPYESPFNLENAASHLNAGFSLYSGNGSQHNYFGRSPPNQMFQGGVSPLQNLLNSQRSGNSPNFMNQNSPNFAQDLKNFIEFAGIEHDYQSEDKHSLMSSLSYDSDDAFRQNLNVRPTNKPSNRPNILDKNLESGSSKEMTMENVTPGRVENVFEDLGSNQVPREPYHRVTITEPQIAGEIRYDVSIHILMTTNDNPFYYPSVSHNLSITILLYKI